MPRSRPLTCALAGALATVALGTAVATAQPIDPAATATPSRAAATFPGTNGLIAFVRDGDIHTMTPDGGDVRRLTSTGDAFFQSWSADGRRLVFMRFVRPAGSDADAPPDRGELWTMDADGGDKRRLLSRRGRFFVAPRFSPDGQTVVTGRCMKAGCWVFRVRIDGTGLTRLFGSRTREAMHPGLSPNGEALALWSARKTRRAKPAIYAGSADASDLRRLTPPRLEACCPDWAPDGSALVFHSHACDPDCPRRAEIWMVRPDGSGLKRLTNTRRLHDVDPTWSPDGTSIAFERRSANSRRRSIYVMSASGGRPRLLERRGELPRWGPAPAP